MNTSPMSTCEPWDLVADGYVTDTQPVLAAYSGDAIRLVAPSANARVLDVACGPGTTTLQVAGRVAQVVSVDFSPAMLAALRRAAVERGLDNVSVKLMDGQALALADNYFDCAFSMFGLMFFPSVAQGLSELHRVLRPGGRVAVSSWAPVDQSPGLRALFGALRAVVPDLPAEGSLSELDNPDTFTERMEAAGFTDVHIHRVTHGVTYASAKEAWDASDRGSAPFVLLRKRLGEDVWRARSPAGVDFLNRSIDRFPATISSVAYIAVATK